MTSEAPTLALRQPPARIADRVPTLELESVTKTYGSDPPVPALQGISFSVHAGELVAIVGPSGSGKSTLLHLMGTLERPSSGRVSITGLDVAEMSDRELAAVRATRIGFVFQQFFLAEHSSALENVADGLLYGGAAVGERRERAAEALTRVGLGDRLHSRHRLRPQTRGGSMKRALVLTGLTVAVALAASGAGARAASSACPTSNPPNELVLAGGSGQQAQLGKQFAQNLQVALANTNGCPLTGNLAGVTVNFDAPGSGASGIFASSGSREAYVRTDSQGVATAPPFTANFTVGNYTVDAHSDYGTVELSLSNTANGLPSSITATGTTSQEATVNGSYGQPLQARVSDANGSPVQGATVTFSILPGPTGASANFLGAAPSATTDSNGLATSPALMANGVPGRFTATASTAGVSTVATYTLDNHATTTALQLTSTHDPKATVGTRYRSSLQARLLDAGGQPIEGATVAFAITAADNGAAANFLGGSSQATALTDANGLAAGPPLIANKTAGRFIATATAVGAQPGRYTLENLAAAPTSITAGAANGQTTTVGERCPIPLAVTVTDNNGNPVAGATIAFAAPARGASGHFTVPGTKKNTHAGATKTRARTSRIVRVRTNSKGIAVAPPFTANASVGGYAVTVTVIGSSVRTAFSLLNLPRG